MRIGLISDTHGRVHPAVHELFSGVAAILHAGDVGGPEVITELQTIAPVHAVGGNVDPPDAYPEKLVQEFSFGKAALAHGHRHPADAKKRATALMGEFAPQEVRMIMHGHSHMPLMEFRSGVWIVNPGSAGRARFALPVMIGILDYDEDRDLLHFQFQELPRS